MNNLKIYIIDNLPKLATFRDEWNNLLTSSFSNSVFLTWEWIYSWCEIFGRDKKIFVIIAEEEGSVIGIAPLCITSERYFGLSSLRHLEFLGTSQVITEYADLIILKGREQELIPIFFNFIFNNSSQWDVINLVSIRKDSLNLELIKKYCNTEGIQLDEYNSHVSPYIELPGNIDEYMQSLSKKSRWQFRNDRRRLGNGRLIELKETKNKKELLSDFTTIIQLHHKRWDKKDEKDNISYFNGNLLKFHHNIINRFFDNGWLILLQLVADGTTLAGQYGFIYRNKEYAHTIGFDPDWASYSVGSVLQLNHIEESIHRGINEFDFLRGGERYKYTWTKKEHISLDIAIWRNKSIARRIAIERKFRRAFKKILPQKTARKIYQKLFNRNR
jgi:CelD/BcsL family acetyltransferase involved in cellulose biosynthesis